MKRGVSSDVSKVVIPAAGLGTRFLPLSKATPKELLPLLDKPAIQYVVEEGMGAEIRNFFIITSRRKQAIEDYLDSDPYMYAFLKERGKSELVRGIERLSRNSTFTYIRQCEPLGLGHAVYMARASIGREYFAVMLPDDIIISKQPAISLLARISRQEKASVIAVDEVSQDQVSKYGVIGIRKQITPNLFQVSHLIEKPDAVEAPSNLAIVGRYVLSYKIFEAIEETSTYGSDEIQLTDAIGLMIKRNERVFACKIPGIRYDVGSPRGWLEANFRMAGADSRYSDIVTNLKTPEVSTDLLLRPKPKSIFRF